MFFRSADAGRGAAPFSLLRWFSAMSFVSVAIASVLMAAVLSRFMSERLIARDAEVGMGFVQSMAETEKVAEYFLRQRPEAEQEKMLEFFNHIAAMPDVMRANVYAPDGTMMWSSRPELIGKRFERNDELARALGGALAIHRGHVVNAGAGKPEHVLFGRQQEVVEYYFPVRGLRDRRVVGVVELYMAPRALWEAIAAGNRLIWGSALAGGIVLYLSLIGLALRADRLLRRQKSELVEAEGLAFVGEVSAAIAHSIRNPLASIRTSAELERDAPGGPGSARETAGDIVRQVDRIEGLLRTLLTYSRETAAVDAQVDPGELVRTAVDRFRAEFAARDTQLELVVEAAAPPVRGDSVLLTQVVHGLLANALEATGKGDRVTVTVAPAPARRSVSVAVADTGVGIAPAQLAQMFKPFQTTKPRGLGLGLALARRIVERLGGSIAMHSTVGSGTRVTLELPASDR